MRLHSLALVVAAAATLCVSAAATADSIGYSMSSTIPTNSATSGIDLTDGGNALDWMAFVGVSPAPASNKPYSATNMPVWDISPTGGTESITAPTAATAWNQGATGPFVQYSNGTDSFGDTGLSSVTSDYAWNWGYTSGTTFTQKLIQNSETLTMPVISYTGGAANTAGLGILATLTNASGTQTASVPATNFTTSEMHTIDSSHVDGMLTLNVAGTVGDTLSVSITGPANGNSGIFGVTVLAGTAPVPEPSTCALLVAAVAGGMFLMRRHRVSPM